MANSKKVTPVDSFNFKEGHILARKYEVLSKLGEGWEGEVYKIRERNTGIERAAKLFYPQRNPGKKASRQYARRLHALRNCSMVIHYHTEEEIVVRRNPITILVSEYVEGELLREFLERQRGGRISPFQGLHLLHALSRGFEEIHRQREYHGDLHSGNVIVSRYGLNFDLKLLDMYHWDHPKRENIQDDVVDQIKLFYDALGGAARYAKQPDEVKEICCGLKRSLILKRYPSSTALRKHLENMQWN